MPRSKIELTKDNRLDFQLEDVEFTAGKDVVKIGKFTGSLDVSNLLHTTLSARTTQDRRDAGVELHSYPTRHKIRTIKALRTALFGLCSLRETKELLESTPVFIPAGRFKKDGHSAQTFVDTLNSMGGQATLEGPRAAGAPPTVLDALREVLAQKLLSSTLVKNR